MSPERLQELYAYAWETFYRDEPQNYKMFKLFKRVVEREKEDGSFRPRRRELAASRFGRGGEAGKIGVTNTDSEIVLGECEMTGKGEDARAVTIGEKPVSLAGIIAVARRGATVVLSGKAAFRKRIESSRRLLQKAMEADIPVYGVTTGYGKSCGNRLSRKSLPTNGDNLMRFHGCGTGEPLGVEETRAAMLCRLLCLSRGYSGVSFPLLEQLAAFLNLGITPVIPSEGSVGASGDLTPLSYLLAALAGEREVFYRGERMPAARALRKAKLKPYVCQPKEPLAMVNGTSVMTGIAAVVLDRAHHLLEAAIAASALSVHALQGKAHHYHPAIGEAKPFPGQISVAAKIRELLTTEGIRGGSRGGGPETLQDPYSLRCAPQIMGVLPTP